MNRLLVVFIFLALGRILAQDIGNKPDDRLNGKTPNMVIDECLQNIKDFKTNTNPNIESKVNYLVQFDNIRVAYFIINDSTKLLNVENQIIDISHELIMQKTDYIQDELLNTIKNLYVTACMERAGLFLNRNDLLNAEKDLNNANLYSDAGQMLKNNADLDYINAKLEYSKGNLRNALNYLNDAININPGFASYYFERSQIYKGLNSPDSEIVDIANALKVNPNFQISNLKKKGLALLQLNDTSDAKSIFEQYLNDNPKDYYILIKLAEIKILTNDFENALDDLNRAIQNGFYSAKLYYNKSFALMKLQRYGMSLENARKCVSLDKTKTIYWNILGDAFLANSMKDSALYAYENSLKIDNGQQDIVNIENNLSANIMNNHLLPVAVMIFLLPIIILIFFLLRNKTQTKEGKRIVEKEYNEYKEFLFLSDEKLNISDQILSFFQQLLDLKIFRNDSIQELKQSIESFLIKKNMTELSVAIIGEFSSGKSTLINAILEQDVLASAIAPTTAVITEIRYSTEITAKAIFNDNSEHYVEISELKNFLEEGVVSEKVIKVILGYPNEILKMGLVIYDTPGINVVHDRHINITRGILSQCNSVIYVDDITRPGKRESLEFLKIITSQITKTIFILNKFDQIDSEELPDVISYYKDLITNKLLIKNPEIFISSAKNELKNLLARKGNSQEFLNLKSRLWKLMQTDRQLILSNDLIKYLSELLSNIESRLGSEQKFILEELNSFIESKILSPNELIESLMKHIQSNIKEEFLTFKFEYINSVKSQLSSSLSRIINLIRSTHSDRILKPTTQLLEKETLPEAKRITYNTLELIDEKLNSKIRNLQSEYYKLIDKSFLNNFNVIDKMEENTYYSRTFFKSTFITSILAYTAYLLIIYLFDSTIGFNIIVAFAIEIGSFLLGWAGYQIYYSTLEKKASASISRKAYSRAANLRQFKLEGTNAQKSRKAGASGMLIGAALGGPIGAMIGGGASAIIGSLFGKGADKVKSEMINTFSNEYSSLEYELTNIDFTKFESNIINSAQEYLNSLSEKYAEVINLFIYQDEIKVIRAENKKKLFSLINQKIVAYNKSLQNDTDRLRIILDAD